MNSTKMRAEALEAPQAIARLLEQDRDAYAALGEELRRTPPQAMLTIARGSSDHAAHFMAYLIMARLGRLVTSLPMSLVTLYQAKLHTEGLLSVAFSQSGQSPDLIEPTRFFRAGGARTLAFVNDVASPLAQASALVFPLHAGAEGSVAATKSYIAQLVCGARLVAAWQDDMNFRAALQALPQALEAAARQDWQPAVDALVGHDRLFVIGRGTGLAIAMEAALKFKETCALHAEAFSGAVLTFTDLAPDLSPALSLAIEAGLGLAFLSSGRDVGAGIVAADPRSLASGIFPVTSGETTDGRLVATA